MMRDEQERYDEEFRSLIEEAFRNLADNAQAPPDFYEQVMAKARTLPSLLLNDKLNEPQRIREQEDTLAPRELDSFGKLISILLISDHAVLRAALRMLLESRPGVTVVGESAGPDDALTAATREQPDIILLDLDLGNANGLDLLPRLHTAAPASHVIVLTGVGDAEMHRRAVRLGAVGLVLKEKAADVLFKAIAQVYAGEVWLDRLLVANVLSEITRPVPRRISDPEDIKIKSLTAREREIITLIGQGLRNQAIADWLCISEATVRHHLTSIFGKLGVADCLELSIYAYRHDLARALPSANSD